MSKSNMLDRQRNSTVFISTPIEKLFFSAAFRRGVEDYRHNLPFKYPEFCCGPNPSVKSAQLAYETGRQFAAWLGQAHRADGKNRDRAGDLIHYIRSIDVAHNVGSDLRGSK